MRYLKYLIIMIIIVWIIDVLMTRNVRSCSLTNFITHNEIFTYNKHTHQNMVDIIEFNDKKFNNILEIGAGNGESSLVFLDYINGKKLSYNYTIVEIDDMYYDKLKNITNNNLKYSFFNKSWTELKGNYDIIISTAFSTLNDDNYKHFRNVLCHRDTFIVTIISIFKISKIKKYNFKIIKKERISPLFYILYLRI
jgi:hypothetical protein